MKGKGGYCGSKVKRKRQDSQILTGYKTKFFKIDTGARVSNKRQSSGDFVRWVKIGGNSDSERSATRAKDGNSN